MNINDYKNYEEITIAQFKEAIGNAESLFLERMKNKDIIGALEVIKLKVQLESLLNKKVIHNTSHIPSTHKKH